MADEVFRQRIVTGRKEHGQVGFKHRDGLDCLRIVSWANGQTNAVEFEIEAALQLSDLIRHAYENRRRPNEDECFSFPEMEGEVNR